MKCWVIDRKVDLKTEPVPLKLVDLPVPEIRPGELLLKVKACGVCHTEIDEIEGRTPPPVYPVIPGHQVVGIVQQHAGTRRDVQIGDRVGVAWIYHACGKCEYCIAGQENLCPDFLATGRDVNGGPARTTNWPRPSCAPPLCGGHRIPLPVAVQVEERDEPGINRIWGIGSPGA